MTHYGIGVVDAQTLCPHANCYIAKNQKKLRLVGFVRTTLSQPINPILGKNLIDWHLLTKTTLSSTQNLTRHYIDNYISMLR